MPKFFTEQEANSLLPQITHTLETLQARKRELDVLRQEAGVLYSRLRGNGHHLEELDALQKTMAKLTEELNQGMEQINNLGCELKDLDLGLIDFRAMRESQEIYLCWKLGEGRIGFWHPLNTGYTGRQPL